MRKLRSDEIAKKRESAGRPLPFPAYVLAHNIRSLYNVGSIFRTSDAIPIGRLYLSGYTPCPPRREIEKTALGATASVPWEYVRDPLDIIRRLRNDGVTIVGLEQTDQSIPYGEWSPSRFPLCLIIGNELTGISSEVLRECDEAIEIPMYGAKHSLNVAVAYGIALFELHRHWSQGLTHASKDRV